MSDPVTNAEVEDVLSSIRRLVSQDKRPLSGTKTDAPREGKLVLTPSLRVSNDAPLKDAYKQSPQQSGRIDSTVADGKPFRGADKIETSAPTVNDDDAAQDDVQDVLSFDQDDSDFDLMADAPPEVDSLNSDGEDVEVSASDATDPGLDQDDRLAPSDPPRPAAPQGRSDILNLGTSELVEEATPTSDRLSAKIAALESAISRIPDNWEPDAPGQGDYSGSEAPAMAWEDDVDLDATGAPLDDAKTSAQTTGSPTVTAPTPNTSMYFEDDAGFDVGSFDDDDTDQEDNDPEDAPAIGLGGEEYLDEEMLRDLVADIVRSELQGALGERITRNVRKLVRREIHRALTAQDLE